MKSNRENTSHDAVCSLIFFSPGLLDLARNPSYDIYPRLSYTIIELSELKKNK